MIRYLYLQNYILFIMNSSNTSKPIIKVNYK
jgi:hypothetical protein